LKTISRGKVEKSERDSDIEQKQTESIDLKHKHKRRMRKECRRVSRLVFHAFNT